MLLYNTLTGTKEALEKPATGDLKLFVCGPTVYDVIHIGNARTYVVFDHFVRYLRARGFQVYYLQNITDVDDKIIERAKEAGMSPAATAKKFERLYHAAEKLLRIDSVTHYARATDHIPEMIRQIETLVAKGHAYKIEGDGYYFDLATFPSYGRLAGRTALLAEDSVSRIDDSSRKKNKGDFCLWKFPSTSSGQILSEGEPSWKTTLGEGRPGWHIEDTAITEHFFGPQYDIHGGGVDIKFPHHEAEIAQQEAASGKSPLARFWMHAGTLLVESKKMSKSLGNFITLTDFLQSHSVNTFRYLVASHHYRSPLDYNETLATQTEHTLRTIEDFLAKLELVIKEKSKKGIQSLSHSGGGENEALAALETNFFAAMDDDFNTPGSLATIFQFMSAHQKTIFTLSSSDARAIHDTITRLLGLFGITFSRVRIPVAIQALIRKRAAARTANDFAASDSLRAQILAKGYSIEDTPLGTLVAQNAKIKVQNDR